MDDLKATCQTYGMGNDGNEYKIITQVFLYKFLLDKYAENGILDFERADILEIPPFNQIGKPTKIIKLFGGQDGFEKAIKELEEEIYKITA